MRITKDRLIITESTPFHDGVTWYRVEWKFIDDATWNFVGRSALNKIDCIKLIEQIDGLELTESNLILIQGNYLNYDHHSMPYVTFPHLAVTFLADDVLWYTNYDSEDMYIPGTSNFKRRDLLSLQVIKNELLLK